MSVVGFSRQSCRNIEKENNYKSCDTCQDRFLCWTEREGEIANLSEATDKLVKAAGNAGITLSEFARKLEEVRAALAYREII